VAQGLPLLPPPVGLDGSPRILTTVRHPSWIYEIGEPSPHPAGYLVEIRRGPREGWRPGASGPYYVVEGMSPETALKAARDFIARHR